MSRRRYRAPLIGGCLVGLAWLILWVFGGDRTGPGADQQSEHRHQQSSSDGASGHGSGLDRQGGPALAKSVPGGGPESSSEGRKASEGPTLKAAADGGEERPSKPQQRAFYAQPMAAVAADRAWVFADLTVQGGAVGLSGGPTALNPRRVGRITSPGVKMDFASNMLSPLWKAELPDGTELSFELAVSQDGESWGPWNQMDADVDAMGAINPSFPDGRPNPNYGFTPGGILGFGLEKWQWFRYRITLSSDGGASPFVSAVRVFYQDTTLGKGRLAELQ